MLPSCLIWVTSPSATELASCCRLEEERGQRERDSMAERTLQRWSATVTFPLGLPGEREIMSRDISHSTNLLLLRAVKSSFDSCWTGRRSLLCLASALKSCWAWSRVEGEKELRCETAFFAMSSAYWLTSMGTADTMNPTAAIKGNIIVHSICSFQRQTVITNNKITSY